jgi:hypothetical protein
MRLIHFACVLGLLVGINAANAQTIPAVQEADIMPSPGSDSGLYVQLNIQGQQGPILVNTTMSHSTLPANMLVALGARVTGKEVSWYRSDGKVDVLPIYRVGPISIGTCVIQTAYFVGNPQGFAWIGLNLLEYLDSYGFKMSDKKMLFSCPQEL